MGGARRRALDPRRRAAWIAAWPAGVALLARRAARFRQHVVGNARLRARAHPAVVGRCRRWHRDGVRPGTDRGNLHVPSAMSLAIRSTADERMDTDCAGFEDYRRCLRDLSRVNTVTLTHRPMLRWLSRETTGLREFSLLDVACGYGDALRRVRRWAA